MAEKFVLKRVDDGEEFPLRLDIAPDGALHLYPTARGSGPSHEVVE